MRDQFRQMGIFLGIGIELCAWVWFFYYIFDYAGKAMNNNFSPYMTFVGAALGLSIWTYRSYKTYINLNKKNND